DSGRSRVSDTHTLGSERLQQGQSRWVALEVQQRRVCAEESRLFHRVRTRELDPVDDEVRVDPVDDCAVVLRGKGVVPAVGHANQAARGRPEAEDRTDASKEGPVSPRTQLLSEETLAQAGTRNADVN